jgi:FtsP/CotA-like multicopper oxidase with cupredoxin domain
MPVARIAFASLALAVLGALWYAFRPQAVVPTAPVAPSASQAAPSAIEERVFNLVVRGGKLSSGPQALRVRQGDQVRLSIDSDAPDELHVHGYDLKLTLKGGEPATLEFAAARSGRFELELHRRHAEIAALEVYPQ